MYKRGVQKIKFQKQVKMLVKISRMLQTFHKYEQRNVISELNYKVNTLMYNQNYSMQNRMAKILSINSG